MKQRINNSPPCLLSSYSALFALKRCPRLGSSLLLSVVSFAFCLFGSPEVYAGLTIYYVRHGETLANVKRGGEIDESGNPVDSQSFTDVGREQIELLTERLKKLPLDFVASSPRERAIYTVLPYLQATGKKGEVWPELTEITTGSEPLLAEGPAPSPGLFTEGRAIRVPSDAQNYFQSREAGIRNVSISSDPVQHEADKRAVADRLARLVRERFGGKDQSVLLIGHGGNARRFFASLLTHNLEAGKAREVERLIAGLRVHNGGIFRIEEQPDGTFQFAMINDDCKCEYCQKSSSLVSIK